VDHGERAHERVGQLIAGRYRLERLLGSGGMGAVYEAVHDFTQRRVAVKLMHPAFARSKTAAERFVREAQAPSSIGHPGIVEVLDGGRADDGTLYLVLELLEGETLAATLRRGALTPAQLVPIALELLDALGAAHEAGFVHRDLKPDNVFLQLSFGGAGETPRVKLLDFGVTAVIDEAGPGLTKAGMILGTPLYMSPEQALGRRVDARSDLWSLGAVCYQALTGHPPFRGSSAQALIVSISTEEHLPLSVVRPGLPLRVVKVIERALDKQPDKRWQSAEEMADALRNALSPDEHARAARALGVPMGSGVPDVALRSQLDANANAAGGGGVGGGRDGASTTRGATARSSVRSYGAIAAIAALISIAGAAGAWALSRPTVREPPAVGDELDTQPSSELPSPSPTPSPSPNPSPNPNPSPSPSPTPNRNPGSGSESESDPGAESESDPESGSVAVSGAVPTAAASRTGLDQSALSNVLRAHDAALQRCYEDLIVAQLMNPGTAPPTDPAPVRLDVQLTVAPDGTVAKLELTGDAPEAMRACARTEIQSWRFPPATAPTELRVPMVFQPNVVRQ
jgi:serine/threonine-protein kinase